MSRAWKSVLVFVLLIVVLDRSLGFGLAYLYKRTRGGEAGGRINRALSTKAQVVLLGSSRMWHHVDPEVLSRKLSLSVYNAGADGSDLLYAAMLMDLWQRVNPPPRMIVLHMDPNSFARREDELKASNLFSFYLDESDLVGQVIYQRSALEPLKYLSSSYRANGKVIAMLNSLLARDRCFPNGFLPLWGLMPASPPTQDSRIPGQRAASPAFWDFKVKCFKGLAGCCRRNGTRLILFHSPRFIASSRFAEEHADHEVWVAALRAFLADYPDVEFLDISEFNYPETFANRPELFIDRLHLNAQGAEILSDLLAAKLAPRLNRGLAQDRMRRVRGEANEVLGASPNARGRIPGQLPGAGQPRCAPPLHRQGDGSPQRLLGRGGRGRAVLTEPVPLPDL